MADEAFPLPGVSTISTLAEWEQIFGGMSTSGVVSGVGSELAPNLNAGTRTAVMASGGALLLGFYKPVSSATGTAIPTANTQNRIDRLVLRLNRAAATAADFIKPAVITGTPSGSPQPPAITQTTSGLWDLPICRWTSVSSGALSGLIDERQVLGSLVVACTSTNRPSNPKVGMLGHETDTGRWIGWNGSQWRVLYDDSGDLGLAPTSGWTVDSGGLVGRRLGSVVTVDVNLRRTGGSIAEQDGSKLTTLQSALRPTGRNKAFAAVLSNDNHCRIDVTTNGEVLMSALAVNLASGSLLRATLTYLV